MRNQPTWSLYALLGLFLAAALLVFLSGSLASGGLLRDPLQASNRLIWPLVRLTGFVSLGLFLGQLIEVMGWTDRLVILARPFMAWGHLSQQMGAAFTTAFVSGTASLSMLKTFHQERWLSRPEVILSVLLNTFPTFLRHVPTTFFIILSLVGKAGVIYIGLILAAALLRLTVILIYTHFALPKTENPPSGRKSGAIPWSRAITDVGRVFFPRLFQILRIVVPVYVIMVLASDMGLFAWLRHALAQGITNHFIPLEAMSVVVFSLVVESTSGYAAAGALLGAGSLTTAQTILALLLGNIIATPVRALRHQTPYYMGIFPPRLGVQLVLITQAFRLGSLILVGTVFVLLVGLFS
jgi:hypothetical protein